MKRLQRLTGKVDRRSEETINPGIPTGEVELRIETVEVQGAG